MKRSYKWLSAIVGTLSLGFLAYAQNPNCTKYQQELDCQDALNKVSSCSTTPQCKTFYICDVTVDINCFNAYDEQREFDMEETAYTVPYSCKENISLSPNCNATPPNCGTPTEVTGSASGVCLRKYCSGSCD